MVESQVGNRTEIDLKMSNLVGTIDPGMAEALLAGPVYGMHHAWHFCGYVWWADGLFHEEVWRHGSPVQVLSSPTLEELMQKVNGEFGTD